ncbi:MAG TPA: hypothetical protein PLU87_04200 [Sedimentisphaerales bacterium]|nr:hypothetical protein [Sedimentisphaerales bacterium]HRS10202.1 hypothetical protein [Sedimentisphaerales bacterium]HRV46908.1 hypothetical protein [Sedimentisphaerales bacterium]
MRRCLLLWGQKSIGTGDFGEHQRARGFSARALVVELHFVDPTRRDYRLTPDSPARRLQDNGVPVGALP